MGALAHIARCYAVASNPAQVAKFLAPVGVGGSDSAVNFPAYKRREQRSKVPKLTSYPKDLPPGKDWLTESCIVKG